MIYYAYYVLGPPLTGYDKLVGSFLMSFTTQVYYANYCKSFYVYTLSSGLFRRIFVQRVIYYPRKMLGLRKRMQANMSDDKTDNTQTDVDAACGGIRPQR